MNHGRAHPAPCVFHVFCVHMYRFDGLIRRTPPPTFNDLAITDSHSDTISSISEHTGCKYPGLLDRKKMFGHVVSPVGDESSVSCVNGEHPINLARRSALFCTSNTILNNAEDFQF